MKQTIFDFSFNKCTDNGSGTKRVNNREMEKSPFHEFRSHPSTSSAFDVLKTGLPKKPYIH
jgi:hypothetical protein